jgi:hypothetical protein
MSAHIILWYLCALLAFVSLTMSAMTVVPEYESAHGANVTGCLLLAIAFGVMAVILRRQSSETAEAKWVAAKSQII